MDSSSRTRSPVVVFVAVILLCTLMVGCLWFYDAWLVPWALPRVGLPAATARSLLSALKIPFVTVISFGALIAWIRPFKSTKRLEAQGTSETLRFEQSVLPVRALPPFQAQTAVVKSSKIWFLVGLTAVNVALNVASRSTGSRSITGYIELWALINAWLSARVSPLQLNADGVRISWHRALNWAQIARIEIWRSSIDNLHRVRFFDASNRKIGQVERLNSPDEWPAVLDYLHARAGR